MSTRAVTATAPGKLFVVGEYAVVDPGNPAVLVAVDRGVTVTITEPGGGTGITVESDLVPRGLRLRRRDGVLTGAEPADEQLARSRFAHVVSALHVVDRLRVASGLPAPDAHLAITSSLHDGGTKLGLGSSGAVTVATVDAFGAWCGLDLTRRDRYRLALLATARLNPAGSGGDLAAGAWGGWIAYRAPDRAAVLAAARRDGVVAALTAPWPGHEITPLPGPDGATLEVGWTGTPASTAAMVSTLDANGWRGTAAYREFAAGTSDCVHAVVAAVRGGDPDALLGAVSDARRLLTRLDAESGLGVFTTKLTALCDAAESVGAAAKPSGAGGGDCGIALVRGTGSTARLRQLWLAAGVRPVPIHVQAGKAEHDDR